MRQPSAAVGDTDAAEIAARLRDARRKAQLSLRDLASRSGMSVGQLSKIETGKKAVSLRHFDSIRKALGVPLSAIFPDQPTPYTIVRREAIARTLSHGRAEAVHSTSATLAGSFMGKRIEPFCSRTFTMPGEIELAAHDTEHFIFVLHGTMEILQAENGRVVTDRLRPGDSLYWYCDVPHAARADSRSRADYVEYYTVRFLKHGEENTLYDALGTRRLPGFRVEQRRDSVAESGRKISFLRQTYGITAARLAQRVGVGVRHLSAVEAGRRAPEIDLLLRIARLFRRPVSYLLGADDRDGPLRTVLRAAEILSVLPRLRGPDRFAPLAAGLPDRAMHAYRVTLAPTRPAALVQHPGEMCLYVLQGEVEFRTLAGGREHVEILRAGDSLFADTGVPYDARGYSSSSWHAPADAIEVFWNPAGTEPPIFDSAGPVEQTVAPVKHKLRRRRSR
jgi:transcriptional regulator with XRE-family HTH domain